MKTKRNFAGILLLAATGIFSACAQTTANTVESAEPRAQISPEQMRKVTTDSSLGRAVVPVMLSTGKADDGLSFKVQLQVQNQSRKTAYVNYRVDWFDAQGMALPGYNPPMQPLAIEGGEIKSIATVAPTPKAVDYRFTFLERKGD